MSYPLTISFHGVESSPALRDAIAEQADRVGRIAHGMTACRVVVERIDRRRHQGGRYAVRAHLLLGECELQAGTSDHDDARHADPYVAVHDAFDALRRQLIDLNDIRRAERKPHATRH